MAWVLPQFLTEEFLDDMEWKEAPVENYELCELGLLRRPKLIRQRGIYPGMLYGPRLNSRGIGSYVLIPPGVHGSQGTRFLPEELMKSVFGKFRNKNLNVYPYCAKLNSLIVAYNAITFQRPTRKEAHEKEGAGMLPMRKCHDCKRPTRSYRCDACWTVVKAGVTACDHPDEEYGPSRGR